MNKFQEKVYLGYEDGSADDEGVDVNYMTNKIGGRPKCPPGVDKGVALPSKCSGCGTERPLVVQCYAPLPGSPYHRTLYVFACINPSCWNNGESWSCYRIQTLDEKYLNKLNGGGDQTCSKESDSAPAAWCSGAEEWGDRLSDSEEESLEMAGGLEEQLQKMSVRAGHHEASLRGSPGRESSVDANVVVDEVVVPQTDLVRLLNQVPDLPKEFHTEEIYFLSKYMSVEEEYLGDATSDHVQRLLVQYQAAHSPDPTGTWQQGKGGAGEEEELYEEAAPLHGDRVFHNFLTRIQSNPSQVLRYSHGGQPLPMQALPPRSPETLLKCTHCSGEMVFEFQILPTLIPSLKGNHPSWTHLEFGTALVYTCRASCWSGQPRDSLRQETVFLQSEPL